MAFDYDEAVSQLRAAEGAGFDISEGQAGKLVNRAVRRLASLSRWVKATIELGPTVADQAAYALPDHVIDLIGVWAGSEEYLRVGVRQLRQLNAGTANLRGAEAAFAPVFDAAAAKQFEIYPAPEASGDSIKGLCAITPPDDLEAGDPLPFPTDHFDTIMDGVRKYAYEDIDENPTMADYYDQRFKAAAEELRRRTNSRVGSGPVQAGVWRYHF